MESKLGEGIYFNLNKKVVLSKHPKDFIGRGLFADEEIEEGELVFAWNKNSVQTYYTWQQLKEIKEKDEDKYNFIVVKSVFLIVWRFTLIFFFDLFFLLLLKHFGVQSDEEHWASPENLKEAECDASNFMNHSCDANTVWESDELMIAKRKIEKGEEITCDYACHNCYVDTLLPVCACDTPLCRGKVSKDDYKNEGFRKLYGDKVMSYIKERMRKEGLLSK